MFQTDPKGILALIAVALCWALAVVLYRVGAPGGVSGSSAGPQPLFRPIADEADKEEVIAVPLTIAQMAVLLIGTSLITVVAAALYALHFERGGDATYIEIYAVSYAAVS